MSLLYHKEGAVGSGVFYEAFLPASGRAAFQIEN